MRVAQINGKGAAAVRERRDAETGAGMRWAPPGTAYVFSARSDRGKEGYLVGGFVPLLLETKSAPPRQRLAEARCCDLQCKLVAYVATPQIGVMRMARRCFPETAAAAQQDLSVSPDLYLAAAVDVAQREGLGQAAQSRGAVPA